MPRSTINGTAIDLDGKEMILDADQDTTIAVDTDDRVDIKVAGTDTVHIDASGIGVNINNPLYPLHVTEASGGDTAAVFIDGPTDGTSALHMGDSDDIDIGSIQYNHSSNYMSFRTNAAESMRLDSIGAVTKPLQPAFHVINNTDLTNITTNNTENTVKFDTESFDINSDFNTTSFTFTAPVTGKYQFNVSLSVSQIDTASTQYLIRLNTSNRNYHLAIDPEFGSDTLFPFSISTLADMDASDTAIVTIAQNAGTGQTDVRADPGSHFSGFLAC